MALDKRLNPVRPDLAAAYLKGQVEAARYVEGWVADIFVGRASLRADPSEGAAQDSELLFGEQVTVFEQKDDWSWVQAGGDRYVGYIRTESLGDTMAATARVVALMTPAFSAPDLKAPLADLLPMNSLVAILSRKGDYVEIAPHRFVHSRHIVPKEERATEYVAVAERFLGVPYVWGGKTFAGMDCSGLVQTALTAAGVVCPRDADMQEEALGNPVDISMARRGDLVFWKGHVGVMLDQDNLLHANAFHMQVAVEPLYDAVARISGPVTAIKRL